MRITRVVAAGPAVRRIFFALSLVLLAGCATRAELGAGRDDGFGVLVMAHGGPAAWNEGVLAAVKPLGESYALEVAFGMADAGSMQQGVRRLEARGASRIAVVRLFVSGESWYERTEQILGLTAGAPEPPAAGRPHAGHGPHDHAMALWRIPTEASFALSTQGLAEAPEMGAVLADRARALSLDPGREDVLILAHGPGDDAENERWIAYIEARAQSVRESLPFRRVRVETLREDWPEKRSVAEQRVRDFVQRAAEGGGRAIVIPFRVQGFGPYARILSGLDYVSDGHGLLPHPNVTRWMERQIRTLKAGPFTAAAHGAIAQSSSNVIVEYVHPERFRDVGDRYVSSEKVREGYLEELRKHLIRRGTPRLAEGQKLSITITEVDMAGSFEPGRLSDIRIVRDVYPPRIDLRFRLTGPDGAVLKEGERKLRDIAFLTTTVPYRTDPLRYEKALLDNWLDRELARPDTLVNVRPERT